MKQPFRSSTFVDFDAGIVRVHPDDFAEQQKHPWDIQTEISYFQCRVDVWQLSPAVEILKQIESHEQPSAWSHSAFALLFVLNPYFEMVGKILNKESNEYKYNERDFNRGFCDVYPNHQFSQRKPGTTGLNDSTFPFLGQLRDRLRNGLSHLGFTKTTFLILDSPQIEEDFTVFRVGSSTADPSPMPVYYANPHRITRTIVNHFGKFIQELHDSTDSVLHENFLKFAHDFHEPHSMKFPK